MRVEEQKEFIRQSSGGPPDSAFWRSGMKRRILQAVKGMEQIPEGESAALPVFGCAL